MYCKLFASLYQGTLRGRSNEILVFTNLLAHAGRDGTVDKHFRAISEETGLSVDEVKSAIEVLESPDPESRSPDENGARLKRMDEHRVWGWLIVNYGKYRAIRSEEDRAEQNRLAQQRWRNKNKPPSALSKPDKPKEREKEKGEAKAEGKAEAILPPLPVPSELAGEDFEKAWHGWIEYRRERKLPKWVDTTIRKQLQSLALMGKSRAIAAIDHSIAQGWQGIYEPKQNNGNHRSQTDALHSQIDPERGW